MTFGEEGCSLNETAVLDWAVPYRAETLSLFARMVPLMIVGMIASKIWLPQHFQTLV
jgi:hypothetical protein